MSGELEEDTRQKIPFDLLEMKLVVRKMSVWTEETILMAGQWERVWSRTVTYSLGGETQREGNNVP